MATIFSHSIAALAFGKVFPWEGKRTTFWILTAVCAALPDIDVIGFRFGVHYSDMLGHRGLTHSLAFAFIVGCLVALIVFHDVKIFSTDWWKIAIYFFIVTASTACLMRLQTADLASPSLRLLAMNGISFPGVRLKFHPSVWGHFSALEACW
jgi:inner membrane protein